MQYKIFYNTAKTANTLDGRWLDLMELCQPGWASVDVDVMTIEQIDMSFGHY